MLAALSATLRIRWLSRTCIIFGGITLLLEGIYCVLLLLTPPIRPNLNLIIASAVWFLLGLIITILGLLGGGDPVDSPEPPITNNAPPEHAQASGQGQLVLSMQAASLDPTYTRTIEPPIGASAPPSPPTERREEPQKLVEARTPLGLTPLIFSLPKEGYDPEHTDDKYAFNISTPWLRYAVTDGVSTSFLPGSWARIIANQFVAQDIEANATSFLQWLSTCRNEWLQWVYNTWIPETNRKLGKQKDWQRDIDRGAQTTLIGCSFDYPTLITAGSTTIQLFAVGDSNFFLLRPLREPQLSWTYFAFPHQQYEDFGLTPDTLATSPNTMEETQKYVKRTSITANRGDYLLLTTDALAEWIFRQLLKQEDPWSKLLVLTDNQAFRAFVETERTTGEMELDDTTMMIVHLQ